MKSSWIGTGRGNGLFARFGLSAVVGLAGIIGLTGIPGLAGIAESAPKNPLLAESTTGMVVSAQHLASDVGAAVLRDGGNAIDAAVATGYALAVTHPCCGNVGGGGFMVIHLTRGENVFLNFRETAPHAATATMYLDANGNPIPDKSINGYLAVGVPGTVMGLETAREKYGTMSRARLLAPAIELAARGFTLTSGDVEVLKEGTDAFRREANVAAIFLNHGAPFKPGERLIQPQLAATLRAISAGGTDAFYHGAIADTVATASRLHGGILTTEDFAAYHVTESPPVSCPYRGYTIVAAPPPSSGGVILCEMLRILAGYDLGAMGFHSGQSVHYMTEAMRYAYFDRNRYLGDPAFVDNPVERLAVGRQRRRHPRSHIADSSHAVERTRRHGVKPTRERHDHPLLHRRSAR
jgi:gamma-glutamyltranspeptidase/glutathione hydrolase